ncbi:MAG: hypothetical protein FJ109_08930 [Deltaproteobacteria bacterium]|nr:hypothetical protein [Deltaproteobacteria bacterium]
MEKLTVEVPPESLCIRQAVCPNGHSLMDPSHPMGDSPSIRVAVASSAGKGELHLHPFYGNHEVHCTVELKDGEVYDMSCPTCLVSLRSEEDRCMFCAAPMFVLRLPKGGMVHGCSRRGCHNHKLKLVDVNAQLAEMFELEIKPRY